VGPGPGLPCALLEPESRSRHGRPAPRRGQARFRPSSANNDRYYKYIGDFRMKQDDPPKQLVAAGGGMPGPNKIMVGCSLSEGGPCAILTAIEERIRSSRRSTEYSNATGSTGQNEDHQRAPHSQERCGFLRGAGGAAFAANRRSDRAPQAAQQGFFVATRHVEDGQPPAALVALFARRKPGAIRKYRANPRPARVAFSCSGSARVSVQLKPRKSWAIVSDQAGLSPGERVYRDFRRAAAC